MTCSSVKLNYSEIVDRKATQEQLEGNFKSLRELISTNPICIEPYIAVADIYWISGSIQQAYLSYLKAVNMDSANVYANYMCGVCSEKNNEFGIANKFYERIIRLKTSGKFVIDENPEFQKIAGKVNFDVPYAEVLLRSAICLYNLKDLLNSIYNLKYCIKEGVYLKEAYSYRSKIYSLINDTLKAASDKRMLEISLPSKFRFID